MVSIVADFTELFQRIGEFPLEFLWIILIDRSGKDNTVSRLHGHGEKSRYEKVLLTAEAAAHFIRICYSVVPIRQ